MRYFRNNSRNTSSFWEASIPPFTRSYSYDEVRHERARRPISIYMAECLRHLPMSGSGRPSSQEFTKTGFPKRGGPGDAPGGNRAEWLSVLWYIVIKQPANRCPKSFANIFGKAVSRKKSGAFACMMIYNKAGITPPKKGAADMWVALFTVVLILGHRAFFPPYPCTGKADTDAEEYDYR